MVGDTSKVTINVMSNGKLHALSIGTKIDDLGHLELLDHLELL